MKKEWTNYHWQLSIGINYMKEKYSGSPKMLEKLEILESMNGTMLDHMESIKEDIKKMGGNK